jgi:hypothetical protein
MTFLPAMAAHFGYCHSGNILGCQGVLNFLQLSWSNDGFDQLHIVSLIMVVGITWDLYRADAGTG